MYRSSVVMNPSISSYEELVKEAVDAVDPHKTFPKFEDMIKHLMPRDHPYTKTHGLVTDLFDILAPNANTDEQRQAESCAWLFQLFQVSNYLQDDLCDSDSTRHGRETWSFANGHDAGKVVPDFLLLDSAIYLVISKMVDHPLHKNIVDIFHRSRLEAALGNRKELQYRLSNKPENDKLGSMIIYEKIGAAKASLYAKLPFVLALVLSGHYNLLCQHERLKVVDICDKLGLWCQAHDDYFDVYSSNLNNDPTFTDAKRGQYSILLVLTRKLCKSEADWDHFLLLLDKQNFDGPKLKAFMTSIGVPSLFAVYIQNLENDITNSANDLKCDSNLTKAFLWFLGWFKKIIVHDKGTQQ